MIANAIVTIGWLGFLAALVYFAYYDLRQAGTENLQYIQRTYSILIVSGCTVVAGYLLKYFGRVANLGTGRCKECGKKIPGSELYCFDHLRDTVWKVQDREHASKSKSKKPSI